MTEERLGDVSVKLDQQFLRQSGLPEQAQEAHPLLDLFPDSVNVGLPLQDLGD